MVDFKEGYRDKERRKPMAKKTVAITLPILFILPAICFAQNVKVEDIKFTWRKTLGTSRYFLTQIPILYHIDERCNISGKFLFLDKDGVELHNVSFCESVEAMESKILCVDGAVSRKSHKETNIFKMRVYVTSRKGSFKGTLPSR
jgi:hypothetical protein